MKVAAKTVAIPASGYWPFGLEIETTRAGLLLRPARKPRAGWGRAFKQARSDDDPGLQTLRTAANDFDRVGWEW